MLHINKLLKLLPNLRKFLRSLESNGICSCLSDKLYLKLKYWLLTGQSLNLKNPSGFCEKLQWLKLYDRKSIYTSLVDKLKVREYVSEKIGNEYLIPMYGAWTSPEEIDFSKLPNQFVLKCNHNSGEGMCICKDKSQINILEVKDKLQQALKKGYYDINRQWPYKDVERKIICEKYMVDDNVHKIKDVQINEGLIDYKFYCFHGEPKFLYVSCACIENGTKHDRLSFYNLDWTKAEFYRKDHPQLNGDNLKPDNLNDMIEISKKLSVNIPFVRVDLYNINNHIYFSELTFSPGGGFGIFYPHEYELLFGSYIKINNA